MKGSMCRSKLHERCEQKECDCRCHKITKNPFRGCHPRCG